MTFSVLIILISDRYSYRYTEMEVHACIGRYKRSNCSSIKGNNINLDIHITMWTNYIVRLRFPVHLSWGKVARGYPDAIFKIIRISSMALLQNKSLFQVLRVDFLTLVWCAHIMIEFECWSYKEVQSHRSWLV